MQPHAQPTLPASTTAPRYGRFLKLPEVVTETSLSRATIYRMIAAGTFPAPIRVSPHRVAWPESTITEWKALQMSLSPT